MIEKSFEECRVDPVGTVYADWQEGPFRCMVMRGPVALCAYVGVQAGNPLYGKDYNEIDIDCHGGLTFSCEGDGEYRMEKYWWLGWDYAHSNDACFYHYRSRDHEHQWTPDEVVAEFPAVIEQFKELSK